MNNTIKKLKNKVEYLMGKDLNSNEGDENGVKV